MPMLSPNQWLAHQQAEHKGHAPDQHQLRPVSSHHRKLHGSSCSLKRALNIRVSSTVNSGKRASFCVTYPDILQRLAVFIGQSFMRIRPESLPGNATPARMSKSVVFPAPLVPVIAVISPGLASKLTFLRMCRVELEGATTSLQHSKPSLPT